MPKFLTLDEFKTQAANVMANLSNQAVASENMADISEGVTSFAAQLATATTQVETLTADNEALRKVNMKFFLSQGQEIKDGKITDEQEEKVIDINDLIDTKGKWK